jgi:hypothetical protein
MRIEKSPLYQSISCIDDASIRSLVYYLVDKNWTIFYDKRIVGLSDVSANRKGWDICYNVLQEFEFLSKWLKMSKRERDVGRFLCFVAPSWPGKYISRDKLEGWEYLRHYKTYRIRNFLKREKDLKDEFLMNLSEDLKTFSCSDLYSPLRDVYEDKMIDKVSIIYSVCYVSVVRRPRE